MDKKIYNFVNEHYISFTFSDLIFRILGILFYNIIIAYILMILSPIMPLYHNFSYNDLFVINEQKLPFLLIALILTIILSAIISTLYLKNSKWCNFFIRGLTYSYFSLSLLFSSCLYDIKVNFNMNQIIILLKLLLYFICVVSYNFYLHKKELKEYDKNSTKKSYNFIILLIALLGVFTSRILSTYNVDMIDICSCVGYVIALCLIVNAVNLLTKAFYAKQYNIT
jgi:hypothetical protein